MVLECFGLPGSGKTTTLHALLVQNPARFRLVRSGGLGERIAWCMLGLLRYPLLCAQFLHVMLQQASPLRRYTFHLWTMSLAETMKARVFSFLFPRITWCIDEGLTQRLISLSDVPGVESLERSMRGLFARHVYLIREGGTFARFTEERIPMSPRLQVGSEAFARWKTCSEAMLVRVKPHLHPLPPHDNPHGLEQDQRIQHE